MYAWVEEKRKQEKRGREKEYLVMRYKLSGAISLMHEKQWHIGALCPANLGQNWNLGVSTYTCIGLHATDMQIIILLCGKVA